MDLRYYEQKETFPFLDNIKLSVVESELKNCEWLDWPEYKLWNKPGHQWQIYPLYGFKIWGEEKKFPNTIAMLKEIPGLRTAIFSRVGPGTKLTPHQGWASLANEVLRCHLGIVIPKDGRSGVEVEGEFRQVEYGKWVVFDDSKMHSGLNEGSTNRIVLLLDIERPSWVAKGKSKVRNTQELHNFINAIKNKFNDKE